MYIYTYDSPRRCGFVWVEEAFTEAFQFIHELGHLINRLLMIKQNVTPVYAFRFASLQMDIPKADQQLPKVGLKATNHSNTSHYRHTKYCISGSKYIYHIKECIRNDYFSTRGAFISLLMKVTIIHEIGLIYLLFSFSGRRGTICIHDLSVSFSDI